MTKLTHRLATIKDAEAIARLFIANVDESYITPSEVMWGRATLPTVKWTPDVDVIIRKEIEESVGDRSKLIIVMFSEDTLVGYTLSSVKQNGCAEIEDFVVSQSYRGMGIGQSLNRATTELLRSHGCNVLFMEVGAINEKMHRFVAADGMRPGSTRYWKQI